MIQRRIVGGDVLHAIHVTSEESRRLVLPGTSCLYSLLSVSFTQLKFYPSLQRRIVGTEVMLNPFLTWTPLSQI